MQSKTMNNKFVAEKEIKLFTLAHLTGLLQLICILHNKMRLYDCYN